jgi:uncharacterized protein (DUF983 family)
MNAKKLPEFISKGIIAFNAKRVTLILLLIGHVCCALLIWFYHNPGLQSWVALPVISGLATIWLLAGSND